MGGKHTSIEEENSVLLPEKAKPCLQVAKVTTLSCTKLVLFCQDWQSRKRKRVQILKKQGTSKESLWEVVK